MIAGLLTSFAESVAEGEARPVLRIGTDDTIGKLTPGVHPSCSVAVLPTDHTLAVPATRDSPQPAMARAALREGQPVDQVAAAFGVSRATLYRYLAEAAETLLPSP
ncbi:helix-turn-helix domain-containing protein [Nocardia jiangsuensis]|uniref:Helix-turn-helix domain-containing protein n=1 Tax=Nocardia jiangsuensis TaxID=1691563 RepID=A0ABV8E3K7_9NOCA